MEKRIDILRSFLKEANPPREDFTYSSVMRRVRKQSPELVTRFMKSFKEAFDFGMMKKIDNIEQIALIQAIKSIGVG